MKSSIIVTFDLYSIDGNTEYVQYQRAEKFSDITLLFVTNRGFKKKLSMKVLQKCTFNKKDFYTKRRTTECNWTNLCR